MDVTQRRKKLLLLLLLHRRRRAQKHMKTGLGRFFIAEGTRGVPYTNSIVEYIMKVINFNSLTSIPFQV